MYLIPGMPAALIASLSKAQVEDQLETAFTKGTWQTEDWWRTVIHTQGYRPPKHGLLMWFRHVTLGNQSVRKQSPVFNKFTSSDSLIPLKHILGHDTGKNVVIWCSRVIIISQNPLLPFRNRLLPSLPPSVGNRIMPPTTCLYDNYQNP